MLPGPGRVNTDRDSVYLRISVGHLVVKFQKCSLATKIGARSIPDGHCNQPDVRESKHCGFPGWVVLSCAIESSTGTRSKGVSPARR
jgi:hypothetical protein